MRTVGFQKIYIRQPIFTVADTDFSFLARPPVGARLKLNRQGLQNVRKPVRNYDSDDHDRDHDGKPKER